MVTIGGYMKKILILLILSLILSGCVRSNFKSAHREMNISRIDSYITDVRVSGKYNEQRISDISRISNYKDEQFFVKSTSLLDNRESIENDYVYEDEKTYKLTQDGYQTTEDIIKYLNVKLPLDGLLSYEKITKEFDEKIGEITYKVYEVNYKKSFAEKILNEYGFDGSIENAYGKIYLKDGELYRISYNINDLIFNFTYFAKGTVKKVNIK
jgi:hypothetical protein